MKKFLVALVAMFCVTAVSAQFSNVGVRFGAGTAITAQYDLSKANHIDGRIGFGGGWTSITGIYNWSLKSFDWTPGLGKWFFDAGVGANVGTGGGFTTAAVVGSVVSTNLVTPIFRNNYAFETYIVSIDSIYYTIHFT